MEIDIQRWNDIAPRLLAFVRKRMADKALAKDIVQDVFLQFYQRGSQVRDPDKLIGWVFRVAQNRIVDSYRDLRRREVVLPEQTPEKENAYNQCVSHCLKEEIRSLPEKYRTAFEMAELQTIPQTRMASDLGLSYSGLKSRVQRARELLRARMKEKYLIEYDPYGNILVCEDKPGYSCPQKSGELEAQPTGGAV